MRRRFGRLAGLGFPWLVTPRRFRAVLPTIGLDILRSLAATITDGDLIVIGAETFKIICEPMGDALGLVAACEGEKIV